MGYVMAGLLSGLGQGMQLMGQQQHEAALEALRNQRQIEQEDRAEARDNRKSARETSEKIGLLGLAQQYKQAEGETEFQYKVRLEKIKADIESGQIAQRGRIDADLATLKARLDQANDAASQKLKADIAAAEARKEPVYRDVDTNGRIIVTFKDGHSVATPFTARDEKGGDSVLPKKPTFKRGPTPKSFDPNAPEAPSNSSQNPTWYAPNATPSAPKVITTAQLNEAAKQAGKSVSEMRAWAKERGYKIQ